MPKEKGAPSPQIVIASDLASGRVVFLGRGAQPGAVRWAGLIGDAEIARDQPHADTLLAMAEADAEARHVVLDPYLIDVTEEDGTLRPTKYREAIRCLGPTIRPDLGKQAEGAEA